MTSNSLRDIFADLLASAENMNLHGRDRMPKSDQDSRQRVIERARQALPRIKDGGGFSVKIAKLTDVLEDIAARWDREDTEDNPGLALDIAEALGRDVWAAEIRREYADRLKGSTE